MEKIYTQLYSYGRTYAVPIAKLDDAIKTKTCKPAPLDDPKEIAERAKTSIYRIITTSIPESNTTMQNMVSPYHTNQDGYDLLYVLSCMVLPFMLHGKNGWGPQWHKDDDPTLYMMKLSQKARDLTRTGHTATLTPIDYAQEMLYRAKESQYADKAAALEQRLLAYIDSNPTVTSPPTDLSIHMITKHLKAIKPVRYSVNKLNLGNPQRKKFEYKNKVQCNACKLFGHNIGEQVCRYAAMHVNTIAYCTENPEIAKKNMKKFNALYSAKQVKKLYTREGYKEILESACTKQELDNGIEEIGDELSQLILYNSDSE